MKVFFFLLSLILLSSCQEKKAEKEILTKGYNEQIEVYNFDQLQEFLGSDDDQLYVVNFWATWCKPCIKELPYFEEVQSDYGDKIRVVLVSLDFPNKLESQLIPFVKKMNLQSEVVLLDDPYENEWIPKLDATWSGAIPATLIFKGSKKKFYERSFTKEELEYEIEHFTKL